MQKYCLNIYNLDFLGIKLVHVPVPFNLIENVKIQYMCQMHTEDFIYWDLFQIQIRQANKMQFTRNIEEGIKLANYVVKVNGTIP